MRLPLRLSAISLALASAAAVAASMAAPACGTIEPLPPTEEPPEEEVEVTLRPGDICVQAIPGTVQLRMDPPRVFLPPGATDDGVGCVTRPLKVILEPDACEDTELVVTSDAPDQLGVPTTDDKGKQIGFGLYRATTTLRIFGAKAPGTQTLDAAYPQSDGTFVHAKIEVVTGSPDLPACEGSAAKNDLSAGGRVEVAAGASLGVQEGGNDPQENSFLWPIAPFDASIRCGSQGETLQLPAGYVALGPAVTFGPDARAFPRDLPMSIPINPVRLPSEARGRHVELLYSGPAFKQPRIVPASDVHVQAVASSPGAWQLAFLAPRLGTYQAVARSNAGTVVRKRRLTHRAVTGISMGGIGSSMFGLRHNELFDVVAPLGGPASWSWLLNNIEQNHMGGFRPIEPGTQLEDIPLAKELCETDGDCESDERCIGVHDDVAGKCTLMPTPHDPYEHPQTFNTWWAEYPRSGTGGRFPRRDYSQIFRDLSLVFGNPNGENLSPKGENLPAGVNPNDPSVTGGRDDDLCKVWLDPIDGDPNKELQEQLANECPPSRCANTLTLNDYFDDEFNPDGTFPVITVCDGTEPDEALTPWANTWKPDGANDYPFEVGLAVDYNGNGLRDELEPIIRAGHEPWSDTGTDGALSVDEPGYDAQTNSDPAGDDYDAQYNASGTERDHRYQDGEPYQDCGLDGVCGTKQQPSNGWQKPGDGYDVGEGDGEFTASSGLQNMWNRDPTSVVRRQTEDLPGGPLDDVALHRVDFWTDGGLRDIFNFHVGAQHFAGSFLTRGRNVTYFSKFASLPGQDPSAPSSVYPSRIPWDDVPGVVLARYGAIDPTEKDIENGSGQHVGTVLEIASRLQTALYYIGSRWPETQLRTLAAKAPQQPAEGVEPCVVNGTCTFEFQGSDGRKGPVTVNFPPGYGHAEQQDRRYPVIYLLHGYGQTPEDLGAAILFLSNWMNSPTDSTASRLPKAIMVYVDGRCRTGADGGAECLRGQFYTDSPREGGVQAETWWLELMDEVDRKFRTLGESEVDWVE